MLVIVGTRTDAHSLRSQVGIESESDCLLGQLYRMLRILDSEAGNREVKPLLHVKEHSTETKEHPHTLINFMAFSFCLYPMQY